MEILKLSVKPYTFQMLKAGELNKYAREIRPNTQQKYCKMDKDGYVEEQDGVLLPRDYDIVQFRSGHETCSFKIESADIELFEDEKGGLITYEENGEEYIAAQVVYGLGERIVL